MENDKGWEGWGLKRIHFFGGPPGKQEFLFKGGVGVLRGVVRAAFTQTVGMFFCSTHKTDSLAMLGQINTPDTPDTPCLHFIRVHRVYVTMICRQFLPG
jgi:hypothetical protein